MKKINYNQIDREKRKILEIIGNKKIMTPTICSILEKNGYEFVELGTSQKLKCFSQLIRFFYMNDTIYFGIGVSSIQIRQNNIYRAYIKVVEKVDILQVIKDDVLNAKMLQKKDNKILISDFCIESYIWNYMRVNKTIKKKVISLICNDKRVLKSKCFENGDIELIVN